MNVTGSVLMQQQVALLNAALEPLLSLMVYTQSQRKRLHAMHFINHCVVNLTNNTLHMYA